MSLGATAADASSGDTAQPWGIGRLAKSLATGVQSYFSAQLGYNSEGTDPSSGLSVHEQT
jgi:hypothetical protein